MKTPNRSLLRWAVPGAVAAAVVVAGSGMVSVGASAPDHSSASGVELVAAVRSSALPALSGTVELTAAVPGRPAHLTARVWSGGAGRARLDLPGGVRVYRSGAQVWVWEPASRTATKVTFTGASDDATTDPLSSAGALLDKVLGAAKVTVGDPATVAGRAARTIVVRAKDGSVPASLRLAVDAATRLPLAIEVRGPADRAVVRAAFTRLDLAAPPASTFRFTPPAGARVTTADVPAPDFSALAGPGWDFLLRALDAAAR